MISPSNRFLQFVIVAGILTVGLNACNKDRQVCLTPKTASMYIESMHLPKDTSTVEIDTALPSAVFTAITLGGDKSFQYTTPSASFTLSLSPVADSCVWLLTPDSTGTSATDTLTFYYSREVKFISNACGFTTFFQLDSAHTTRNNITGITINNTSVTNNANVAKHIKLHIKPNF